MKACSTHPYKVEILHSLLTPGHVLPHGKRQGRFKPWGDSKLSITEFENQQQHTFFFPCTRNMESIPCHLYLIFGQITNWFFLGTGIPQFMLLIWGHIKNRGKRKPRKLRLLSSTKGEENRIEL